jgi:hypothetical protein
MFEDAPASDSPGIKISWTHVHESSNYFYDLLEFNDRFGMFENAPASDSRGIKIS